jgi:hypothetical protein
MSYAISFPIDCLMKVRSIILAVMLGSTSVMLAAVTGVGTDITAGANWRTAAALEADNEYGTDGYVIYGVNDSDGQFRNPYAFDKDQIVLPAGITGVTTNTVQMWSEKRGQKGVRKRFVA